MCFVYGTVQYKSTNINCFTMDQNVPLLQEKIAIDLPGDFSYFTHVSIAQPDKSSFYIAFGASFIESLLRVRIEPDLTEEV